MSTKNAISKFNRFPFIKIDAECWVDWPAICVELRRSLAAKAKKRLVLAIDLYPGTDEAALRQALSDGLKPQLFIDTAEAFLSPKEIEALIAPELTSDAIFGKLTHLELKQFFSLAKIEAARAKMAASKEGLIVVFGVGAALFAQPETETAPDLLVFADMARWEIQLRFRADKVANLAADNFAQAASLQYKRAFFIDWRVCDKHKRRLMQHWDYLLDTNDAARAKMITGRTVRAALKAAVKQPFSLVPFFDPGPWGGQWMKEVCGLDPEAKNYAWCFNCVPEENSLLLGIGDERIELPALDLVYQEPRALLGETVHARFGCEFPIRFDFLDTMCGGNLSLQVHPVTEYIQEQFGMHYTQDESYYIMDAGPAAVVYLGLREPVQPEVMIDALKKAQTGGPDFDAERFIATWPCRKHDHFLIPAGTVHCSGSNAMVLEISATPYIFTFKLWDWGRLGMDGKPRPINIEHGRQVIQWDRDSAWTKDQLVNHIKPIASGDGWQEESTGLHEREFIETRRHWFEGPVEHDTQGTVNVLALVEGSEVIVESPTDAFEPFIVHYAETFIVPAAVGAYRIRPHGAGASHKCATIKAFVR